MANSAFIAEHPAEAGGAAASIVIALNLLGAGPVGAARSVGDGRSVGEKYGTAAADLRRGSVGDGGGALLGLRSDRGRAEERQRARRPAATSGVAGEEGGEGGALDVFCKKKVPRFFCYLV